MRFELQPQQRRLLVSGQPATLGARAFDLLLTLAERPDRLMTKGELLDTVWPGLVVEEANLHVQMSALRKVLGGDIITTVPGRGYRFAAAVERAAAPAAAGGLPTPAPVPAPAAPLPPAAPAPQRLFGRDDDLQRLLQALALPGCVSVVGPSGVGKTRLARAALASASTGTGAVWVDLAPLNDGAQVSGALARALGLALADGEPPLPQLLKALAQPGRFVALDNAEHVVQATAELVDALLQGAPQLHLLVTTQMPLAVPQERVQRLAPLAVDAPGGAAVALLAERITAADHRFRLQPEMEPVLRAICRHLDGLPLALEMAAARVPLLGLQGVHDALEQRFALLTRGHRSADERHRTLRQALDWSYRLLTAPEQALFRALGVFAGGFTLELAVAVGGGADNRWDVIEQLAALVDRSLVTVSADEPPRYGMLETLRAFALQQLAAEGEEQAARQRHAQALAAMLEQHVGLQTYASALCLAEVDNLRDAIVWAREHGRLDLAATCSALLHRIVTYTPWCIECGGWLQALEAPMRSQAALELPPRLQAFWWSELGRALIMQKHPRGGEVARHAAALWRPLGDVLQFHFALVCCVRAALAPTPEFEAACAELLAFDAQHPELPLGSRLSTQGALGYAAELRNDVPAQLAAHQAEYELACALDRTPAIQATDTKIASAQVLMGRFDEALARSEALLQRIGTQPDNEFVAWAWRTRIDALLGLGRLQEARTLAPRALAAAQRFELPIVHTPIAALAARLGRAHEAALMCGCAAGAFAQRGVPMHWWQQRELQEAETSARAALGAAEFERALAAGQALDAAGTAALVAGLAGD